MRVTEKIKKLFKPEPISEGFGDYKDGKKHGKWIWYYSNDVIWREEFYNNGKRNGHFHTYSEKGDIIHCEIWEFNKKIKYYFGDKNKIEEFYTYNENRELEGEYKEFYFEILFKPVKKWGTYAKLKTF